MCFVKFAKGLANLAMVEANDKDWLDIVKVTSTDFVLFS